MKGISRFSILSTLLLVIFALRIDVQAEEVRLVGIIGKASHQALAPRVESLKQGMMEYGYFEGKNVRFVYRFADGNYELLPGLADELKNLDVDVIVAAGCPAAEAAKTVANSVPVVVYTTNPVLTGLINSFARPGGNITGMTLMTGSEFHSKRLELLKLINPSATLIGVLWNPTIKSHQLSLKEITNTATNMGLSILPLEAESQDDIDRAFRTISSEKPDALINFGDTIFTASRKQIADYAIANQLPTNFNHAGFINAGILMSYGPDPVILFNRLGSYVGKILNGAKPEDLPVERPSEFDLVLNLETAEKVNIIVPPEILLQATKIIK